MYGEDHRSSFCQKPRNRSYVREVPAGFGLERLATAFMKNPGYTNIEQAMYLIRNAYVLCRSLLFFQELPLQKLLHENGKQST